MTHHNRRNPQGDNRRQFNSYTEEKALKAVISVHVPCLQMIPDVSAPRQQCLDSGLLKGKTPSWLHTTRQQQM
ncbi:hypothetical protein DAPPUDRAFT_311877 [Daphnia pulex]|uniref:Uncharacterized protein n=1 Tax=Daphnia pulex TaxID=6669 RepID=E9FY67_DAPPU|nr:hypothetical protein DAPPUDRAFT_311877 [Daphnia pulex]|eukprot:EFX87485.1 hypothetical protein DAPPUDRAFT_311877 [Daphnia pulex]